jgi:hypothetical protein
MASRTRARARRRARLRDGEAVDTDVEPGRDPIPPGWPGDDPTLPEEVGTLGGRPARRPPLADPDVEPPADPDDALRHAARDRHRRERSGLAHDHRPRDVDRIRDDRRADVRPDDRRPDDRRTDDRRIGLRPDDRRPDDRVARGRGERPRARASDRGVDEHEVDVDPHEPDTDLDDDDLDLIAGVQPAGRVLVVMVAALVLAMLVNADALVARAERKPPGPERDRSLAIWHPVQDVSHVLQLYRVRQVADWVAGDDDEPSAAPRTDRESRRAPGTAPTDDTGTGTGTDGETETETGTDGDTEAGVSAGDDGAFALRTPTADEPLRLLVSGDFTAQVLGGSLERASDETGVVDTAVHHESASGLTRDDYFDWSAAMDEDIDEHDPEVVVVVLGVNDAQGIVVEDGTPAQLGDPRWAEEYRRRVGGLMDRVRADERMVVWVGQPPMRDPDFGARMAELNQIYAAEAAGRPWVTFVDPAALVGGPDGGYAQTGTDAAGAPVELRQPDGIHLTPAAGDLIAAHVLDLVGDHVDLDGEPDEPAGD